MKIVVLDGYTENPGDLSWDALKELGEVTVYDRTSYEESPLIAERIGDAEIVIINKTPISKMQPFSYLVRARQVWRISQMSGSR